ncbi:hypothetical protein B0H13DRAFT_1863653 [Mycena leptocephala]|nr:hypothetical protein B0H13DRAFT_1863653 [Mycena leptocephala]
MSPPLPYGASSNLPVAQASAALSSAPIRNPYEEFTGPQFDEWILNITIQLRRALEHRAPNPAPQSSEARDATNGDDADVDVDDSFTELEPGGDAAANAEGKGRGPRLGKWGIDIELDWEGGEEVEDDEDEREDNEDGVETSEEEEEVENTLRNEDPPQDGDDSGEEGTNTASLLVLPSKCARIVERESEDLSIQKDAGDAQNDGAVLPGSSPIYSSPVEPQYSPSANHDVFILYKLENKGAHDTHNRMYVLFTVSSRTLRRAESKSSDWDHRPTSARGVPLSGTAYLAVEDGDIAQFPQPDKFPELETFVASDQLITLCAPSVPLPIVSDLLGPVNSIIRVVRQDPRKRKRTRAEAEGFSAQAEALSAATSRPQLDRTCKRRRQSTTVLTQSGSPGKERKTKKPETRRGAHIFVGAVVPEWKLRRNAVVQYLDKTPPPGGDSYIGKPPHVDARAARLQYNNGPRPYHLPISVSDFPLLSPVLPFSRPRPPSLFLHKYSLFVPSAPSHCGPMALPGSRSLSVCVSSLPVPSPFDSLPPFQPRSLCLREAIFPAPPFVITLRHPPSGMRINAQSLQ